MTWILFVVALLPRPELVPVGQAELAAVQQMLSTESVRLQSSVSGQPSAWDSPIEARVPGRFAVGFKPGAFDAVSSWIGEQGGNIVRVDEACGFLVGEFPQGCASQQGELARSASRTAAIRYFEPAIRVTAAALPNDPYFIPYQWDKWVMYADRAWDVVGGSMDVKVAVVDNGCDYQHPDLAAGFKPGELGYDFIGNDNDPRPDNYNEDEAFHGTHVAGIIGATRNNNAGIAGWSLVQLLAVRVLNDSGSGTTDVVASGVRWAADHGARIVNMSLTSPYNSTPLEQACDYAAQRGVVIVVASGNEGHQAIGFPAALDQCIAVGATSEASQLASFSNYGPEQELVAPGTSIVSCAPDGVYVISQGTSMASPQIAGVAALLIASNWGLSATEVRAILDGSAIDMGVAGRDIRYGYGFVNSKRAVDLAAAYAASRAPQVAGTTSSAVDGRTYMVRAGSRLPSWIAEADVYDGSGRLVRSSGPGLRPGTYFVRLAPESSVPRRLLVLD
ncbi:peptidase S8 [candidate division WOR-3 bacterium]|nr:peptidase S8 [candidate division WOR-3 bacterium]